MDNSLGGSNEPFLNKPARHKELSTNNAVRRGRDTKLLKLCIKVLSSLKSSKQAITALEDAIYFSFLRNTRRKIMAISQIVKMLNKYSEISRASDEFIQHVNNCLNNVSFD